MAGLIISFVVLAVPVLFIFFADEIETNITVGESYQGVWNVLMDFNHQIANLLTSGSFVVAIIVGVCALVLLLGATVVIIRRI